MAKKSKALKSDPIPSVDESWKHEDDARTLQRAGEVLSDPTRLKHAHKHIKKQKKAFRSVEDLVKHRNAMFLKDEPEDHDSAAEEKAEKD